MIVEKRERNDEAVVVRVYPHPVARVYRAWTVRRHIENWLRPNVECRLRVSVFDFREGGTFFFDYEWGNNASPVRGTFLTIVPEQTLAYSWNPQPPDPYAGKTTTVTVRFKTVAGGTEVVVKHTLFPDRDMRDRHGAGWAAALDLLAEHLGLPDAIAQTFP